MRRWRLWLPAGQWSCPIKHGTLLAGQQVTSTVVGVLAMSAFRLEVPARWADLASADKVNEALSTSSILPLSSA